MINQDYQVLLLIAVIGTALTQIPKTLHDSDETVVIWYPLPLTMNQIRYNADLQKILFPSIPDELRVNPEKETCIHKTATPVLNRFLRHPQSPIEFETVTITEADNLRVSEPIQEIYGNQDNSISKYSNYDSQGMTESTLDDATVNNKEIVTISITEPEQATNTISAETNLQKVSESPTITTDKIINKILTDNVISTTETYSDLIQSDSLVQYLSKRNSTEISPNKTSYDLDETKAKDEIDTRELKDFSITDKSITVTSPKTPSIKTIFTNNDGVNTGELTDYVTATANPPHSEELHFEAQHLTTYEGSTDNYENNQRFATTNSISIQNETDDTESTPIPSLITKYLQAHQISSVKEDSLLEHIGTCKCLSLLTKILLQDFLKSAVNLNNMNTENND